LAVGPDALAGRIGDLTDAGCTGVRFVPVSVSGADAAPAHALVDCLAEIVAHRQHEEAL